MRGVMSAAKIVVESLEMRRPRAAYPLTREQVLAQRNNPELWDVYWSDPLETADSQSENGASTMPGAQVAEAASRE